MKKRNRYEIAFTGAGGQGMILAGLVMADAVAIVENRYAVQSAMYGPEARLGSSRSDVIISDSEIGYPKATRPDLLLVMNQDSCTKYTKLLKENGLLICDTTYVSHIPGEKNIKNLYKIPFSRIARSEFGTPLVANIMALGFISAKTGIVKKESLAEAIKRRVKEKFVNLNLKALEKGYELGKEM